MFHSHAKEHADHVFNSQFDDVRERYASEIRDLRINDLIEADERRYLQQVWDAGFGRDEDAYEAYWKRLLKYASERNF